MHVTDTPIELLESILACLSITLELLFELMNPSSLLRVLGAPLRVVSALPLVRAL